MLSDIERAAAIHVCAVAASTPGFLVEYGWTHIYGASEHAWDIAFKAYLAVDETEARWSAAEALLRSGWAP